jgi:hypothetical protein
MAESAQEKTGFLTAAFAGLRLDDSPKGVV